MTQIRHLQVAYTYLEIATRELRSAASAEGDIPAKDIEQAAKGLDELMARIEPHIAQEEAAATGSGSQAPESTSGDPAVAESPEGE